MLTKKLPKTLAINNKMGVAASKFSSSGPVYFEKDTTAGFLGCLVTLSKMFKAEPIDAALKLRLLKLFELPSIAPYSTTT